MGVGWWVGGGGLVGGWGWVGGWVGVEVGVASSLMHAACTSQQQTQKTSVRPMKHDRESIINSELFVFKIL